MNAVFQMIDDLTGGEAKKIYWDDMKIQEKKKFL